MTTLYAFAVVLAIERKFAREAVYFELNDYWPGLGDFLRTSGSTLLCAGSTFTITGTSRWQTSRRSVRETAIGSDRYSSSYPLTSN